MDIVAVNPAGTRFDGSYPLAPEHRDAYARDGFVRLPGVFDAAPLAAFAGELTLNPVLYP